MLSNFTQNEKVLYGVGISNLGIMVVLTLLVEYLASHYTVGPAFWMIICFLSCGLNMLAVNILIKTIINPDSLRAKLTELSKTVNENVKLKVEIGGAQQDVADLVKQLNKLIDDINVKAESAEAIIKDVNTDEGN